MGWFAISVEGEPPVEVANKFWVEISRYNVNFLVLAGTCYIYGDANDEVIDTVYKKAKNLGFPLSIERG